VVAALVGAVPGTKQVVRHVAACELHAIMQFVTVPVCAMRIFPEPASAELQSPIANPPNTMISRIATRRIIVSRIAATIIAANDKPGNAKHSRVIVAAVR